MLLEITNILIHIFKGEEIEEEYLKLRALYPKSRTVKINLLKISAGPRFEKEIYKHLKESIQKGHLASFKELKFIYSNKDKIRIVQNTLIKMLSTLKFFSAAFATTNPFPANTFTSL